jgi:hypothetical protein
MGTARMAGMEDDIKEYARNYIHCVVKVRRFQEGKDKDCEGNCHKPIIIYG